jgi:hypothetical protein
VTGTITPGGTSHAWTFSATTGDAIVIRIGEIAQTGTFTPRITLLDPAQSQVQTANGPVAAEIAATAASTGTFTIMVNDVGTTATGSYRLTLAKTGSAVTVSPGDTGGPMTNGLLYAGTIDVGDMDVWTVAASINDHIVVRIGETTAGALTPHLRIYAPTGGVALDSASSVAGAEVELTAAANGNYMVIVSDFSSAFGGSGGYRLTLAKTGSPVSVSPGDEGGPLSNGIMHTGTIEVGDLDVWTVDALVGERIVVRIGELVPGSPLTPQLRIYGPAGGAALDAEQSVIGAEVEVTAAVTGTYLVVVGDFSSAYGGSGGYRLTMVKTGSPVLVSQGDEGGPLTNGFMHTGVIDVGDLDVWTVDALVGERIIARVGETVPGSPLTPQIRIYGPGGGTALDAQQSVIGAEVEVTAPAAGTYLVVIGDFSSAYGGSGGYRLTLVKTGSPVVVAQGDEGGPLTNGVKHTGVIDVGDLDVWTVDAVVGERILVRVGELTPGSPLTPELRIYGPNGGIPLDAEQSVAGAEVEVTAPATGQYLVVVGDFSSSYGGSGGYRLTLAKTGSPVAVSPGDEGGALVNGAMHTGTLDVGDLDVWTVNAVVGERIIARVGELTGGSTLTPQLRIYGPNGGAALSSSQSVAGAEIETVAASSGQFLVVVSDFSSAYAGSGGYRLTLATPGRPVLVSPGDQGGGLENGSHNGFIDIGDLDVWTIYANAGDHLVISMTETVGGSTLTPQLRLYGPTGALVAQNNGVSVASLSPTVAATGTYMLLAGDFSTSYAGSGAYVINGTGATGFPLTRTLDVDASSPETTYDALTDGLLVLRYLFAMNEGALTDGTLGATATRTDPDAIVNYLDARRAWLDIDLNGAEDPWTDGLLIIRYLFGLRDTALTAGATDPAGTRQDPTDIANYIQSLMP